MSTSTVICSVIIILVLAVSWGGTQKSKVQFKIQFNDIKTRYDTDYCNGTRWIENGKIFVKEEMFVTYNYTLLVKLVLKSNGKSRTMFEKTLDFCKNMPSGADLVINMMVMPFMRAAKFGFCPMMKVTIDPKKNCVYC